jgi:hypothetical protein
MKREFLLGLSAIASVPTLLAGTQGSFAQSPRPIIVNYEQCLQERRRLRDEAKQVGDKAWEITLGLEGVRFISNEVKALYAEADKLRDAADRIKCVLPPKDADKSVSSMLNRLKTLRKVALTNHDPLVKTIISSSLKAVAGHADLMFRETKKLESATASANPTLNPQAAPAQAQVPSALPLVGSYQARHPGVITYGYAELNSLVNIGAAIYGGDRDRYIFGRNFYPGLTFDGESYRGRLKPMGGNSYEFEGNLGRDYCKGWGRLTVYADRIETTENFDCEPYAKVKNLKLIFKKVN